jgi:hypothetical protein
MKLRFNNFRSAGIISISLAVALFAGSLFAPASAESQSQPGLFGSQSPTYDGVFRQSLSIIALTSAKVAVPAAAEKWLKNQQCKDGSFEAFRASTTGACKASDLNSYSGKDSNSTAMGAIALMSLGEKALALKAVTWLRKTQNVDGGMPWLKGGLSDSASSALALLAVRTVGLDPAKFTRNAKSLTDYIRTATLGCSYPAAKRGGVAFQTGTTLMADDLTSAQVAAALNSDFPVSAQPVYSRNVRLKCPGAVPSDLQSLKDVVAGYTAARLKANKFKIPSAFGSGTDWSSTSWSVLGLVGAHRGLAEVNATVEVLKANVNVAIVGPSQTREPGKIALLILVATSRNLDPKSFGDKNLVSILKGTLQ